MPLQGPQKYTIFATAHGQAGVQYKARSSELRKTGDIPGANKHARIGRLHDAAAKAIAKIAKAHTKEQERGVQALRTAKAMVKEDNEPGKSYHAKYHLGKAAAAKYSASMAAKHDAEAEEHEKKGNKAMADRHRAQAKFFREEQEDTNMLDENLNTLFQASLDRKPLDFQKTFSDLIRERVSAKIGDLKVAVAQQTFAVEEEVENVDEGKTFKKDDEGKNKRDKFEKRRVERHKREVVDEEVEEVDEEAQELDEVSSELAKRYLAKAEGQYKDAQHTVSRGALEKAGEAKKIAKKRFRGIERASFKEELESQVFDIIAEQFDIDELTEEQVEGLITEISKKLAQSYKAKAEKSKAGHEYDKDYARGGFKYHRDVQTGKSKPDPNDETVNHDDAMHDHKHDYINARRGIRNRSKGITQANKRLAK